MPVWKYGCSSTGVLFNLLFECRVNLSSVIEKKQGASISGHHHLGEILFLLPGLLGEE